MIEKWKLRWFDHVLRFTALCMTILQGTVKRKRKRRKQKKRWEENIKEWDLKTGQCGTGMCKDLFGAQLLCKVMGLTEQMLIKISTI